MKVTFSRILQNNYVIRLKKSMWFRWGFHLSFSVVKYAVLTQPLKVKVCTEIFHEAVYFLIVAFITQRILVQANFSERVWKYSSCHSSSSTMALVSRNSGKGVVGVYFDGMKDHVAYSNPKLVIFQYRTIFLKLLHTN